eukprot:6240597-Prorocentrum_lima.AAC.1
MTSSLVGSEMCIRDRKTVPLLAGAGGRMQQAGACPHSRTSARRARAVSYTHLTLPTICSV